MLEAQKQLSRSVLMKRCSENMQQIFRRTPMLQCDFNKVAKQLYWNCTSAWEFSCKRLHTCSKKSYYMLETQKQPSRGVLRKRCSENIQQIYKRTPMPKCDFNKDAEQLYWNHTLACVFSCKFSLYFQNTFF